ncbi:hypothetical protein EMCRGX_G002607 [Ephydatia muelleri]
MMTEISCNYAITTLRTITQKQYAKKTKLDTHTYTKITEAYNQQFSDYPDMVLSRSTVVKKLKKLMSTFNKKWNPTIMRTTYMETFSPTEWMKLCDDEKKEHSVRKCTKCPIAYGCLHSAFHHRKGSKPDENELQIFLTSEHLSSPKKLARNALLQLNAICSSKFGESAQSIIARTPGSQLISSSSRKRQLQENAKQVKSSIQKVFDDTALETVMGNRLSWRFYDRARKVEGLESKCTNATASAEKLMRKRIHGCSLTNVLVDKEAVLAEASAWSDEQKVNWSELARRHGVVQKNGGQMVKEFLQACNIPAACRTDVKRAPRRRKKKILGGITMPMKKPSAFYKNKLSEEIEKVLVSAIYDPALYVTDEEVFRRTGMYVNVQAIVERPELHIIGRSTSSIEDQRKFIECRRQCMQQMGTKLFTSEGLEITDVLRFFHGDGPAQQFEAGHSIGGNYCCVGCGARSTLFDDIVHCYRSPKLSFKDRQEFVLKGASWEKNNATPFDGLSIEQLRVELARRCIDIKGKKRPQLDKDFEELKMGIVSVPALLQTNPTESLESLNLVQYEVSPLEPLHDIKGHFSNVIEESICIAPEGVKTELHKIQAAVLSKDTLRGCDYRKAMILMYLKTKEIQPDSMLCKVFQTAVQISKILYASEAKRTPKSILNLHNIAFYHAYLCAKLFLAPKHMTRRKLFGRYFHALTTHSPLLYRIICLRSLNTEIQERMFSQVKQISKTTSNQSTDNIVTNAIKRLHYEEGSKHEDTIAVQESEIEKLAKVTGPFTNTCFTIEIMKSASYQSHIERISDYLVCGPGVWWKTTNDGVEFFDGDFEDDYRDVGPTMHHFRSSSLVDIDALLLEQWEQCITENIQLPAVSIVTYGHEGAGQTIQLQN